MKRKFLLSGVTFLSGVAIVLPTALTIACSPRAKAEFLELTNASFSQIALAGDVAHFQYNVPKALTHVDEDGYSTPDGTIEALTILARTTISDLASYGTINNTFMPLPVLQAYLAGQLQFSATDRLEIVAPSGAVDVQTVYGNLFGFNRSNFRVNKLGVWETSSIELKFVPKSGYRLIPTMTDIGKPSTQALKNYVNLDKSVFAGPLLAPQFVYANTSVHNNVTWQQTPTIASLLPQWKESNHVADLKFTTKLNFTSSDLLATPPTSYAYAPNERVLYAVLTPESGYALSSTTIDIAGASGIASIPSLVDELPNYDATNLSNLEFSSFVNLISTLPEAPYASGRFAISAPAGFVLPQGTALRYSIDGTVWLDSLAITSALKGTPSATGYNLRAKLVSSDPAFYVVNDGHVTTIKSTLKGLVDTKSFFDDAEKIRIDATASTATTTVYTNLPALSAEQAEFFTVEYLIGNYETLTIAQQATAWKTTIDEAVVRSTATRLFVRLTAKPGYVLSRTVADLTASSSVNKL